MQPGLVQHEGEKIAEERGQPHRVAHVGKHRSKRGTDAGRLAQPFGHIGVERTAADDAAADRGIPHAEAQQGHAREQKGCRRRRPNPAGKRNWQVGNHRR